MTWANRFRLTFGVLVVVVLVAGLTLIFNQRQNQTTSYTAEVTADTYFIGADHAGTVIEQSVALGDVVTKGQELFAIQSLQLKQDIANGLEVGDTEAYRIDRDSGVITYVAVIDGMITELNARQGNSVPVAEPLATLSDLSDRVVEARFRLVPREYARITIGSPARIRLANDEVVAGEVSAISATTGETGTVSTMTISSTGLSEVSDALVNPGAPVTVAVEMEDTGPLAGVAEGLTDFLAKIGLR